MRSCLKLEMNKELGLYSSNTELAQHTQCPEFSPWFWKHLSMVDMCHSVDATDVNIYLKSLNCIFQTHATFEY